MDRQAPDAETDMTDLLIEKIDAIPSLPETSDRVLSLLSDEDTTFGELEQAIKMDQSLSAKILRFANSRYYGYERQVTTLEKAIQLLGFNTIRSVVITHSVEDNYSAPEIPAFPRENFWEYSLACGICCEVIAEHLGYDSEQKGEVFCAGHLHATGRTILDQHLHREFIRIFEVMNEEGLSMYEAEKEVLETTHCRIGAAVLDKWNLPDPIVAAARHYYEPEKGLHSTVDVVHLASVLTKTKGYGFSGDEDLSYLDESRVEALGFDDNEIERILDEDFPRHYERLRGD
ncbi:MAG: HDOD domain-containing protein [bacterium]